MQQLSLLAKRDTVGIPTRHRGECGNNLFTSAPITLEDIPEANTGLCVAAALGVTFPFNLALGIPLYGWWVNWLAARA